MKNWEVKAAPGVTGDNRESPSLCRWPAFLAARGLAALLILGPLGAWAATDAPKTVALLNIEFLNDHQDLEPTKPAEQARLVLIGNLFKTKLEAPGRYKFVSIPAEAAAKISAGPEIGTCGGCEFGYGKELGADTAAWIVVQKVSDLILNINVYMADVAARKMTFVHSVDIRSNTDESWAHGMTYLVKNYLLPSP